jgi:hypothetical protein
MIDWKAERPLVYAPVPFTRAQSDDSDKPGEQTVNPEGLWRRSGESWHFGAGQIDFDRKESNEFRFNTSQGVEVFEKFQFSLLKDTDDKELSADSNLRTVVAGTRLYYTHGANLDFYTDITPTTPTPTAVTGHPANASTSIATDGFNIWTAHGTQGIYKTTRTTGAMASHITGTVNLLGYVRNRVMAAAGRTIYDVTALAMGAAPGALPAALFTHPNTDFVWVDFAENNGFIYAAGFSGDKSLIYKISITDDATALGAPAVAGPLPDGELVTHINGYLGNFLFIGTTRGYRLALALDTGELRIGALVETPMPVLASEPQGDFIYYSLGDFSSTHSGIGKLSTNFFTDIERLVPAYASHLMMTGQANILSIVTFQDLLVFTVDGVGLFAEHQTRLVEEGYIDTGRITYGQTEPKIGIWFDFQHSEQVGGHEVLASFDGSAFISLGTHTGDEDIHSAVTIFVGIVTASAFEYRLKLTRDPTDDTKGLTFRSWLFRAQPTAEPTDYIYATVIIAEEVPDINGVAYIMDTHEERDHLTQLRRSRSLARWEQGHASNNVILEDFELVYKNLSQGEEGRNGFNSSCLLKMKVVN